MPDADFEDLSTEQEDVLAYIEADEPRGVTIEQIIRDLEIPGRLLPEIMESLLERGLVELRENRYHLTGDAPV